MINREDIIRMAREARVSIRAHYDESGSTPQELERFFQAAYAAGAAAEREACAKVCEDQDTGQDLPHDIAVIDCAAAIRARGNTGIKWEIEP